MQIIEIYKSLQGESSYTGLPCVFVRLAGCNLRCVWCDSEYTFHGGQRMSLEEIEVEVHRLSPNGGLVEITGGEPLLQEREAVDLMGRLLAIGYTVLLETSGERPLERVPAAVVKIVDVKCPDSGEGETFRISNLEALGRQDEVKFVVASRQDYEFARDFHPAAFPEYVSGHGDFISGISQGRIRKPRCFALYGRPAASGRVDADRRAECQVGAADS